MDNDLSSKVIVICSMKVRMLNRIVRTLSNVKYYASKLINLISLGAVDDLGYDLSTKNNIINI